MKGKNIYFDDKKKKMNFTKKKKVFRIDDVDVNKILVLKKNHTVLKKHLNTLLDIMIMM